MLTKLYCSHNAVMFFKCVVIVIIVVLQEHFLRGKGVPNLSQYDVHAVSGCVKYFLRSLKEPLITHSLWKDFITAADKSESQDSTAAMYQAISELPRPNKDTLAFLIMHLQRYWRFHLLFNWAVIIHWFNSES